MAVATAPAADLGPARAIVTASRRRGRAREVSVTVALALATVAALVVSISLGDFPISLTDVVSAAVGLGDPADEFVVQELRLPRAVTGLLVGLAFGISGAVFQSLANNELASPDVIGITEGASTTAVFMIAVVGAGGMALSAGALAAALGTAALIYVLAYRRGVSGYRLILIGIGVAAALQAGHLLPADPRQPRGGPGGDGVADREPQRASVGARPCRCSSRWSCSSPRRCCWPAACAACNSATTRRAASASASSRRAPRSCSSASGWSRFGTAAAGPVAFVALDLRADRPPARRPRPPRAAGRRPRRGRCCSRLSDVIAREAFGDGRAAGRRHHRHPRRAVPAVAAGAHQPQGHGGLMAEHSDRSPARI